MNIHCPLGLVGGCMKNNAIKKIISIVTLMSVLNISAVSALATEVVIEPDQNAVEAAAEPTVDPAIIAYENEKAVIEAMKLQYEVDYFNKSVFIGDSVMVGFKNYTEARPTASMGGTKFLTATSFSAWHALRGIKKDKLQPKYQGEKRNVWDSVAMMDVDRAFMMFGTNDLIMCDVEKTANNIIELGDRIAAAKPGVEIHIISMPPVYSTTNKNALTNPNIVLLDARVNELCQQKGYYYVDLHSSLVGADGAIIPAYSSDKYVHHSNKAYEVWAQVMVSHADSSIPK